MKSNLLKRSDKQTRVWFVGQLTCCKSVCLFECPSGRLGNPHNERHLHLTLQWEGKIRKSFHPYLEIHSSNSEQWSLHRAGKKSKQLFCATYTSASQHGKSNGVSKELYLSRHTKQSPDRKKVTVVMNVKFLNDILTKIAIPAEIWTCLHIRILTTCGHSLDVHSFRIKLSQLI